MTRAMFVRQEIPDRRLGTSPNRREESKSVTLKTLRGVERVMRLFVASLCLIVACSFVAAARGAVLFTETFDSSNSGWVDRDSGEMIVSHSASMGQVPGSLQGSFGASLFADTDAFRASGVSSSGNFSGDYQSLGASLAFRFDFLAQDVVPSALQLRFNGGGSTLFKGITVGSVGSWVTYQVALDYSAGWFGGSGLAFTNALASVNWVDVQVTMNGTSSQSYFLDNFQLMNTGGGGGNGGGNSAVPEPASLVYVVVASVLARVIRRTPSDSRRRADSSAHNHTS